MRFSDIYKHILVILPASAILYGCSAGRENTYNTQEDRIDKYLSSVTASVTYPGTSYKYYWEEEEIISMTVQTEENSQGGLDTLSVKVTVKPRRTLRQNGSNKAIWTEGTGEEAGSKAAVTFYYEAYTFDTRPQTLFATNMQELVDNGTWTVSDPDCNPVTLGLDDKNLTEGLRNGLLGSRAGEESYIIFSGKYGFGKKPLGTI
ncbi:MAG: hypothetical protein ACI395_03895, partial [Candidatus Cryptobacteroides sp.]